METGTCSHLRDHIESNVDRYIPETGDKGESLDVNAGAHEFALEREAVFSLESSIHQLLCLTASATVTGRKVIQRCLRRRFSIGVGASLHQIGLERKALPHRL